MACAHEYGQSFLSSKDTQREGKLSVVTVWGQCAHFQVPLCELKNQLCYYRRISVTALTRLAMATSAPAKGLPAETQRACQIVSFLLLSDLIGFLCLVCAFLQYLKYISHKY